MFNRLSNHEVTEAIDTLIATLGVREEVPCGDLRRFLWKKDTQGCVQQIAARLGLPVRIDLSYVPKDSAPGNPNRFESSSLAHTDWHGRGIEGITAQVLVPQRLPMFGTADLAGYPIKVRVSEGCHRHSHAFIAIVLHELSHVLLASLFSPHKDSELHTDLIPVILGFRETVRTGRKVVESRYTAVGTETTTTTYGYLTDAQFDLACRYVTDLLTQHARNKRDLHRTAWHLARRADKVSCALSQFREYFCYLDANPPRRMKPEHAQRVVTLHGQDNASVWENDLSTIHRCAESAQSFVGQVDRHYLPATLNQLALHARKLEPSEEHLRVLADAIRTENRILRRYVPVTLRLKRFLFRTPLFRVS